MTNISTLPKSDIVSDAKPELALVEVASAKRDFPLGVIGKSFKRTCATNATTSSSTSVTAESKTSPRALR